MFSWDDCRMIFALFDSFVMRGERMIFDHCDWLVSYVCLCVYIYITYLYTLYCIFTSNMMKADDKLSQMLFIPLTY